MPIEIKELHIRATVIEKKHAHAAPAALSGIEKEKLKKELIKSCVHEVLQILEDKKER
jgi:hypothetical protein